MENGPENGTCCLVLAAETSMANSNAGGTPLTSFLCDNGMATGEAFEIEATHPSLVRFGYDLGPRIGTVVVEWGVPLLDPANAGPRPLSH